MLTRILSVPLLLLFFCTWGTFLAGLICSQANCQDGTTGLGTSQVPFSSLPDNLSTLGLTGTWGWSARVLPCARLFRFYWFMMAFALVVWVAAMVTALTRFGLRRTRNLLVGLFAAVSLLHMIASEASWAALDSLVLADSACMRVMFAGAVSTAATAILLTLAIGTDWEGGWWRRGARGRGGRRYDGTKALPPIRYGLGEPRGDEQRRNQGERGI